MEKEKSLVREINGAGGGSKRHHTIATNTRAFSVAVFGSWSCGNEGQEDGVEENWKVEKSYRSSQRCQIDCDTDVEAGSHGGSLEGEEAFHLATAGSATKNVGSRKRMKLHGKVSEDCGSVDPAMVPRRLRSAINKRGSQSTSSPSLPDTKKHKQSKSPALADGKKHSVHDVHAKGLSLKPYLLDDNWSKDELEVAEMMAAFDKFHFIKVVDNIEGGKIIEGNSEGELPRSPSQASKQASEEPFTECNVIKETKFSVVADPPNGTPNAEASVKQQATADVCNQKIDIQSIENAEDNAQANVNELIVKASSSHFRSFSNYLGSTSEFRRQNGLRQPHKLQAAPPIGKDQLVILPLQSASSDNQFQADKQSSKSTHCIVHEERAEVGPGSVNLAQRRHASKYSSSKLALCKDAFGSNVGTSSIRNSPITEKLYCASADRKRLWTRSITHVYISHLIQNHQNREKKLHPIQPKQTKAKDGANSGVLKANETVGSGNGLNITYAGTNGIVLDRNLHENRMLMLEDGRLISAQQASALPGNCFPNKQVCDFMPSLATSETKSSGIQPVQLSVPCMHNHSLRPAMLPLQQYVCGSIYAQQTVHSGSLAEQQQQQMCQAHIAHYVLPPGFAKLQNGGFMDSNLIFRSPPPSVHCPSSANTVGGSESYHQTQLRQHHIQPLPLYSPR